MAFMMSATMMTLDVMNSTVDVATEKPLEEFLEVKAALIIDRIYIPLLVVVGLAFNSLCFVTFIFTSLRSTSTCVYMAAIAVLDSMVLAQAFCVLIRHYLGQTVFYMRSDWACGLQFFLFYFTIHLDVLILLAMTVDRFIVVRFPLKAQTLSTPKSAVRVIIGLGIFSFALNFQIFFNRRLIPSGNVEDPLKCWYPAGDVQDFMEKVYTIIDATIYSFVPFLSLLTLNLLIIIQLKQARKFSKQFTENRDTGVSSKGRGAELKAENTSSALSNKDGALKKSVTGTSINVMFLLVSFTFLLLTSPVVILLLYGRHYWNPTTNAERAQFLLIRACVNNIMYSNHGINFLLYCISGRRFRQELKKLLAQFCCRVSTR